MKTLSKTIRSPLFQHTTTLLCIFSSWKLSYYSVWDSGKELVSWLCEIFLVCCLVEVVGRCEDVRRLFSEDYWSCYLEWKEHSYVSLQYFWYSQTWCRAFKTEILFICKLLCPNPRMVYILKHFFLQSIWNCSSSHSTCFWTIAIITYYYFYSFKNNNFHLVLNFPPMVDNDKTIKATLSQFIHLEVIFKMCSKPVNTM